MSSAVPVRPATQLSGKLCHSELRRASTGLQRKAHGLGAGCIAAPVFDASNNVTASLSIFFPVFRAEPVAKWQRDVARHATDLSEQLGHSRIAIHTGQALAHTCRHSA